MTLLRLAQRESRHGGSGQETVLGTSFVRSVWLAGVVGALLFATGCGGSAESRAALANAEKGAHAGHAGGTASNAAPATLEELAAKTGCDKLRTQASGRDMRQSSCMTAKGQLTMMSFTTDQGEQEWLSQAESYGGSYLIGPRWIIVGAPAALKFFQGKLGGKLETVEHGGHA